MLPKHQLLIDVISADTGEITGAILRKTLPELGEAFFLGIPRTGENHLVTVVAAATYNEADVEIEDFCPSPPGSISDGMIVVDPY